MENPGPAWLFCPADRPERFGKAAAVADVVILDLEDGVGADDKDAARHALRDTPLDPQRTVVRINPAGTPEHAADLDAVAGTAYRTVMLAKTEAAEQVSALSQYDVVALIETPLGAVNVAECARVDNTVAVMWGSEDLFASLGGTANRYPDGRLREVASHVRSSALLAAKAYSRLALDSVFLDIKDLDGLRTEVDDSVAVGFDAKVAIHPTQIAVIREGYTPASDRVEWAQRVLAAAENQRGVFAVDGMMVDMPILRRAQHIIRLSGQS